VAPAVLRNGLRGRDLALWFLPGHSKGARGASIPAPIWRGFDFGRLECRSGIMMYPELAGRPRGSGTGSGGAIPSNPGCVHGSGQPRAGGRDWTSLRVVPAPEHATLRRVMGETCFGGPVRRQGIDRRKVVELIHAWRARTYE
jgi:hypothetical protein